MVWRAELSWRLLSALAISAIAREDHSIDVYRHMLTIATFPSGSYIELGDSVDGNTAEAAPRGLICRRNDIDKPSPSTGLAGATDPERRAGQLSTRRRHSVEGRGGVLSRSGLCMRRGRYFRGCAGSLMSSR